MIIRLPKKGDLTKCDYWRGITLLSVPRKVFCIVLLRRLQQSVDNQLREQQAGFRRGRSCYEQIFVLRSIIEQTLEHQQRLSINFVDFVKAFDSIHRESLWSILRCYGVPIEFIELFRDLYRGSTCCIRTEEGITKFFNVATGVRQGCTLSPFLFLIALDFVMRRSIGKEAGGIPFGQRHLVDLDFADDIALIGSTQQNLANLTTKLANEAAKIGLKISSPKTKVMRIGYVRPNVPVLVGQQQIEEVDRFTYLGSVITSDGNAEHDISCRLGNTSAVYQRLRPIWLSSTLALTIKIRLFYMLSSFASDLCELAEHTQIAS